MDYGEPQTENNYIIFSRPYKFYLFIIIFNNHINVDCSLKTLSNTPINNFLNLPKFVTINSNIFTVIS